MVFSNTLPSNDRSGSDEVRHPVNRGQCEALRNAWQVGGMPIALIPIMYLALCSYVLGQTSDMNRAPADQLDLSRVEFERSVAPMLRGYCADCHLDGANEGGLALDPLLTLSESVSEKKVWEKVLKQLRHDLMPPADVDQPATEEQLALENWVKTTVFEIDEDRPDPGHVTVRRLNRIEYKNTIKDLIGYEIDTKALFPPDDSGHGFDNIAEVLSLSPLLMEKYINAATEIVSAKVPIVLTGPLDDRNLGGTPHDHAQFFPKPIPAENEQRRQYAKELLTVHAKRAFRRPPEPETIEQLVDLAESVWTIEGASFEKGIAQAMIAILSSPSFIFRETFPQSETFSKTLTDALKKQPTDKEAQASSNRFTDQSTSSESVDRVSTPRGVLIDEYSLATRLSYFLWSTTPDANLMKLADEGQLRKNLDAVVKRMIKDERFESFYENFMGQWLLTRDIEGVNINAIAVVINGSAGRAAAEMRATIDRLKEKAELSESEQATMDATRGRLRQLYKNAKKFELTPKLRRAMRRETEMLLKHIVDTDSDLVQLIDCDYTFLNERLAEHYGITGVTGDQMRKVQISPADHRGGLLTHGSVLAVTSNPDRTSPVKRGLFVLDNLLGLPPGAPPPDIPALEQSSGEDHSKLTLRQSLAKHRADPLCSSCHDRMDPLGLALENFDALGRYRANDANAPIDASGDLISGESFKNIDDLKKILAKSHKDKFYRCVTEKLMTYALGRSIEYYDLQAIDNIVNRLGSTGGKPSVLIEGVIKSPAFQMTRVGTNTKHP